MKKTFDVLGVKVDAVNLKAASEKICAWVQEKQRAYVCIAPVSTIVDCQKDDKYLEIVNNAGMITPDGMPIVWLGKLAGNKDVARTYGPDLLLTMCDISQDKGYSHYFYGGSDLTNKCLVEELKKRFPRLTVSGSFAPAHKKVGEKENKDIIEMINNAKADILWVGLGSPKQDYWMSDHRKELNVPVMIGVGAAFDFIAGTKPQAPKWMQGSGLEWLFRLIKEPKRLWKRYLIGNPLFIWLLFRNWFKKNIFNKKK